MLQQTQVATVIPYWERWMTQFPTIADLAAADEQAILAAWQGLGYYRRVRLLQQGAQWIASHGLPNTAEGWRAVPGIGPYTAGAISSIAQGVAAPLVDGNVERVYARLTGDAAEGPALNRAAWRWAERELYRERPGDWNQALMELGATICRPVEARCGECPLESRCVARQSWQVASLPTKSAKRRTVKLQQAVWAPRYQNQWGIRQIPNGQWWEGMWEFPRADYVGDEEIPVLRSLVGEGWLRHVGQVRHSVTHHRIELNVTFVRVDSPTPLLRWVTRDELAEIPMPSPQRKVLALLGEWEP